MEKLEIRRKVENTRDELMNLSKEELVDKILALDIQAKQLKNIISKRETVVKPTNSGLMKPFNFEKSFKRHILLKFFYFGWNYQGFAKQDDTNETIEDHLFNALIKTCLIQNRETSNYHRCGRTDKGVSSFGQVISIDVRSKLCQEEQISKINDELNYVKMLNRVLPTNIQCIMWCPAPQGFSARFDCKCRLYKYFFPKADLNINAMKEACSHLIGVHDFRNLCKMDVGNAVTNFVREILLAEIECCEESPVDTCFSIYMLTIKGTAFLWHQIRCIVGILLLVGENREEPQVLLELLDVNKNPRKPEYNIASEIPLTLYACEYDLDGWVIDEEAFNEVASGLQAMWTASATKATMMRCMLSDLMAKTSVSFRHDLLQGVRRKQYLKLMDRQKCEPLESRIEHYVKRKRLKIAE